MAAIQGYLETLLANPSLDAQRRTDFLEKSIAQTERLRRLLADISTITRMDEASQLIQKERVVLNDLIAEVTADMELKPADQRLRVNIDFPQQVEIVGSPSLLASIFRNLADNASAYSGGRDIFIRLLSDTPRRVHDLVRRQRHRHRRGAPAAHLRTLLPYRQGPLAQAGRHGAGAGDRQKRRHDSRRHDHGPRTRTRRAGVRLHLKETQLVPGDGPNGRGSSRYFHPGATTP